MPARSRASCITRSSRPRTCATSSCTARAGPTPASTRSNQIAHLDVRTSLPPESLRRRINDALPADINVLSVEKVPHKFHARHDAVARAYVYMIARRRTAFAKPFVWWVKDPLDVASMRQAAQAFVGRRDFRGFTDDDPDEKSTIVEIGDVSHRRGGRRDSDRDRRLALPLEAGASTRRRARRDRQGLAATDRRGGAAEGPQGDPCDAHCPAVRTLPRARVLSRRRCRRDPQAADRADFSRPS